GGGCIETNRLGPAGTLCPPHPLSAARRAPEPRSPRMTPTSPRSTDKRTSGNPAKQAEISLTVKQQREQKRQEKLAEYQRQLARRRRGKVVGWTLGVVGVAAIVAAIIASFVFAP